MRKENFYKNLMALMLCGLLCSFSLHAQNASFTVTGKVTDAAGVAIPGATVLVKDQPERGTSTDMNGNYSLSFPVGGGGG